MHHTDRTDAHHVREPTLGVRLLSWTCLTAKLPHDLDDLPSDLSPGDANTADSDGRGLGDLVGKPLSEIEGSFIGETLQFTGGNREEAAKLLGIGERTLYRKIKDFDL